MDVGELLSFKVGFFMLSLNTFFCVTIVCIKGYRRYLVCHYYHFHQAFISRNTLMIPLHFFSSLKQTPNGMWRKMAKMRRLKNPGRSSGSSSLNPPPDPHMLQRPAAKLPLKPLQREMSFSSLSSKMRVLTAWTKLP